MICSIQFLEAAGRIAFARWLKPGEVPDAAAAIAKLAERMSYLVKPDDEPDAFHDRVWLEEVEDGAKKHLEGLRRAFKAHSRAGKESEIPNFKGSNLGRFPLVSADFWTSDHLSERSRSMDAFPGTRARGTLTLKRR